MSTNEQKEVSVGILPQEQNVISASSVDSHESVQSIVQLKLITTAEIIAAELKKFNISDEHITQLSAYKDLYINGVNDKDGYAKVKEAHKEVKRTRIELEERRKDVKSEYLQISRKIDDFARDKKSQLEAIEEPLSEKLKAIDAEKENEKKRKEREEQETLDNRIKSLHVAGMSFDGSYYSIVRNEENSVSMTLADIRTMSDVAFYGMYQKVASINEQIHQDQEEARILKEESDRQQKEQAERKKIDREKEDMRIQKEKEQFEADKKEFERQKAELYEQQKAIAEQKKNDRIKELSDLGMVFDFSSRIFELKTAGAGYIGVPVLDVTECDNEKWAEMIEGCKIYIAKEKDRVKEKAIREAAERENEIQKKIESDLRLKEAKAQEDAEEKQRLHDLKPDVDKFKDYLVQLQAITSPEITDEKLKKIAGSIQANIDSQLKNGLDIIEAYNERLNATE